MSKQRLCTWPRGAEAKALFLTWLIGTAKAEPFHDIQFAFPRKLPPDRGRIIGCSLFQPEWVALL
jgi:hypothetical protein